MKDLFIITTYAKNLPPEGQGLFCDAQKINKTNELDQLFDTPRSLWRLHQAKQFVFGTACLDKNDKKEQFDQLQKKTFITAIVKDVMNNLSIEEKGSISRLFVIAHGYDLDHSQISLGPVTNHDLLNNRTWLSGLAPEKKEIEVYFMAFSHVDHALYRLLQSGAPIIEKNLSFDQQLAYFYEIVAGWRIDKDWLDDWFNTGAEAEKVKALHPEFNFEFYYAAAAKITKEIPADYPRFAEVKELMESTLDKGCPKVKVVFTPLAELAPYNDLKFYENIISTFFPIREKDKKDAAFAPVIFIGCKNIMLPSEKEELKDNELDPRYRFLDSSIWCRYVAIENGFADNLQNVLNTIAWAYDHRLYQKNVCLEFMEFQNRLVLNSYLSNIFGDGHSLKVFPFRFHSESKMELNARKYDVEFRNKKLTWNFLLIDDYTHLELREGDAKPSQASSEHCKGKIIETLITSPPKTTIGAENQAIDNIYFKSCISVHEAEKTYFQAKEHQINSPKDDGQNNADQESKFLPDIILLDYLFSESGEKSHYGTDFLKSIGGKKLTRGRSVAQKYWIHPISVFNEAMLSEMQEQSYQHFEPDWYLARGADPINTPHLFRCSLFEFMDVQSEFLLFDQKELWSFLIDQDTKSKRNEKTRDNPQKSTAINQQNALNAFRNFLEKFSADEGVDPISAIGKSAKAYMQDFEGRDTLELRDHLRKILFLFAYTAGFDFPAIEREFKQIDRIYRAYYNQNQDNEEMKDLLIKLKTAMDNLAEWVYDISDKYS